MYCPLDRSHPCPIKLPATATYLGEDDTGYYVMDGFFDKFGNMFKRMVKFNKNSFKPANLYKGFINTTLTAASMGTYQLLPKNIKKMVYNVGKVAVPVIAGGVAAYALGPSVMSMMGPKLTAAGNLMGKAASSLGGSLFQSMMKLPGSSQSAIAQQVTPQDLIYAENNNGALPPHLQALVDREEQKAYAFAMETAARREVSPTGSMQQPPDSSFYADSALYPGLKKFEETANAPASEESPSLMVPALVGGGLLLMLLKK